MENGVEMNDKPHLGETKLVEDGVSELEVSDRDVGGFHESKDSEGDEVFEEAVDAQIEDIQIQEQQPPPRNPDRGDGAVNGDVDVAKDRDSDPLEVGESANGGHEAENFVEAMELHLPTEDQGLEKVEDLEAVEPPMNELGVAGEAVDVEDNVKEVLAVESDGLVSRVVIGNVEDVEAVEPISEQHEVGGVKNIVKEAPAVEPDGLASHGVIGNVEDVEAVESINELSAAGDVVSEENNVKEGLAVESDGLASHIVIGNVDDVETVEPITKPGVAGEVVDVKDNVNEVLAVESDGMASDTLIGNVEDVEAVEPVNELGVAGEVLDVKDNVNEVLAVESDGMASDAVIGNVDDVEALEPVNELRVAGEVLGVENNVNGVLAVQSDGLASHAVIGNVEDVEAVEPVNDPGVAVEVVDVEDDDVKEVLAVESDGLVSDGMIGNVVEDVKDVAEVAAYEETEPLVAGGEANVRPDIIVEKNSENRDLDMVSLEKEILAIPEKLGNGDVHKVVSDGLELSQGNESIDRIQHQDDRSGELQDVAADLVTERQHHVSAGLEDSSAKLDTSVDKEIDIAEDITTEVGEKIKADTVEAEAKDCIDSQRHSTDGNIKEGSHNHAEVEEPEKNVAQDEVEKNKPATAREPEIQSAADVGSSPGNSAGPAPHLPPRPAGLGAAAPLLEPAYRAAQQSRVNGAVPQRQAQLVEDPMNGEAEENDETREKLQMIRVKFLRLAHRLGQTPHNVVVAQVLYRLGLAEQLRGRNAGRTGAFSFERASAMAVQLEAAGQEPLDFSCTIMVLGKTGVGKSATINSIFDEVKFSTDAFQLGTKKVQDVVGTVQGIKVRVIDTPGLLPSWSDQRHNEKILHSVKQFIKKTPPDIVLYLDRLDMQSRDFGDMPLLRTITEIFGPSIWFNAIVVLTHAASAPPDGPNGTASSYEMFVTQRSHVVQQVIRQAAGDMRLMNPVSLVENHSACRTNRAGQRVLPNGQVWKPHLLLLSFASKILAEANTLLKLQDSPPGKPFATRSRVPPLPFLLSSLLQSRPQLKLPEEQLGDEDTLDEDLDEASDSDDESDYDELPPFKRLTKAQLSKLSKAQKKAYYDELEYREKLFMKKQLKEEKKRRKLLKKMAASAKDLPSDYNENEEEESGGAASVPVPMPDLSLPTSFDSDNPTHRYRCLDSSNQWLVRPVLETHGWDHDVGYEGINVERLFVVKEKIPLSFSGQVTKDKKESNLQMELASLVKHGEGKATSLGIDMQTVGKDMAYTLRSETRFSNFRHNKTAAGLSVTLLGDALTAGVKLEDKLIVNKRFRLVMTGGAMTGRGDVAYGGSLEATLRDKDYPLGRTLSTLGLSIMDWHGDLAIGCNLQSQFPIGRSTNMIARANLNNRGAGQVSIRLNSSEQLQIALVALVPLFRKLLGYSQQIQFGQ